MTPRSQDDAPFPSPLEAAELALHALHDRGQPMFFRELNNAIAIETEQLRDALRRLENMGAVARYLSDDQLETVWMITLGGARWLTSTTAGAGV